MSNKKNITYVDDELANLKIIQQGLEAEYNVGHFHSAKVFLETDDIPCDLLLLDVQMPDISGYQVCETLRAKGYDKPILFLSAYTDIEDRLKGYQAGGDDYIGKPFHFDELNLKIKNNLKRYSDLQKTKKQLKNASSTAITAMNNASEMGVALLFTQKTHLSENEGELASALKEALRSYGLNAVFCFRQAQQTHYDSTSGTALSELEKELLDAYQRCNKISTHGNRCLLSSKNVSILIKNMPQDMDKKGRLRDHLALILDTNHQHVNFLVSKNQQAAHQDVFMSELRQHTQQIVTNIDAAASLSRNRVGTIVENVKQELFGLELKLDLNEEDSKELQNISVELQEELDDIVNDFDNIEQHVNVLIDAIQGYQPS
ncbi:MAG: response regulator [Pseudomonadales bacterium]|nr:response regulator [Pseudomonadales bacterium]